VNAVDDKHACAAANCPRRCKRRYPHVLHPLVSGASRALQATIYRTCEAGMGADYDAAVKEAVDHIARREAAKAGLS
jgi:hypothetical protein